jgi:hypothetical protein
MTSPLGRPQSIVRRDQAISVTESLMDSTGQSGAYGRVCLKYGERCFTLSPDV